MDPLQPRPDQLTARDGRPITGLWAGGLTLDPRAGGARRGRRRSWSYTAVGNDEVMVGAAIVDLGIAATAFAWIWLDGQVHTWDAKGVSRVQASIGRTANRPARFRGRGLHVLIDGNGALDLDVPIGERRLQVRTVVRPATAATLVTDTAGGGWNATQKVAGEAAEIEGAFGDAHLRGPAQTWRDWTMGAQDRHTRWRWAAAAGHDTDGGRVGINLSTGMNEHGPGENVVWWDDVPYPLDLEVLGPVTERKDGPWRLSGPDWSLAFAPTGSRSATENLLVVRSSYVQPVGRFRGTLPHPDGPRAVDLVGVTEHHTATW